jgi:hypothetical protein
MRWCRKDGRGSCLETLKKLVQRPTRVEVELRDGLLFIDEVIGVASRDGGQVAVFTGRGEVGVDAIEAVSVVLG